MTAVLLVSGSAPILVNGSAPILVNGSAPNLVHSSHLSTAHVFLLTKTLRTLTPCTECLCWPVPQKTRRAGETAQCLPPKREDLSSTRRTHIKNSGVVILTLISALAASLSLISEVQDGST